MSEPQDRPVSETSQTLEDRGRGPAERVALGNNPAGSMLRIVFFIVGFIVIAGGIFIWLL